MAVLKPTSKSLFIFFLLVSTILIPSSTFSDDDDDLNLLEELLAIDEEEQTLAPSSSPHAGAVTRANRVVLDLTDETAERAVAENSSAMMVIGFAPWCPRSAELMPRFVEAAEELRRIDSGVVAAKLDADRHPKAAAALGIKGFPTLLLFVNGTARTYAGSFTA